MEKKRTRNNARYDVEKWKKPYTKYFAKVHDEQLDKLERKCDKQEKEIQSLKAKLKRLESKVEDAKLVYEFAITNNRTANLT